MEKRTMSRRGFMAAAGAAAVAAPAALAQGQAETPPARIAFIGVGNRGTGLLKGLLQVPGTAVTAICDIDEEHLNRAIELVNRAHGNTPAGFSRGPYDYRRMLERDDFDAVLIATPAPLHAEMSVDAMLAGKHVASEVPGAYTIEECWNLVKTKEKTGKRYMLLENYNYARQRMMVYNMIRAGVFGDVYYGECSYIHDCRSLRFESDGSLTWRGQIKAEQFGNLYPTHSLGPVSKWLDINRGDRLVSLVSMMSRPAAIHAYAENRFGADSAAAQTKFINGDMCVTLIKTANGRLITVYYDSDSPRPADIFYLAQGPQGVYDSRRGIYIDGVSPAHQWEEAAQYAEKYEHEYWKTRGEEASRTGHGGGDYFVVSDFVEMARRDEEPWIDVYDSATWSSVVELSQQSIRANGSSVEFPDFTGGKWKDA
ncbi:MAG: Gfo/Idh/MocA family oxidoreductase [Candidatus Hydrogenedentes bacterium]|nr:Gfo/Idh/MocA family oxidoreductase [Candidatus Hydrogenedentota bacterium]